MAKKPTEPAAPEEKEDFEDTHKQEIKEARDAPDKGKKAPAPEEAPEEGAENKESAGEPVNPPAGSHKITLEGEESDEPVTISVRGEARTLPRGVEIEVGDDIMNLLEGSSIKFKKGKS